VGEGAIINHQALVDQVRAHEGCVLHAYSDSLGFTTIGVGRMIDARKGGGITLEEAEYLLGHDLLAAHHDLELTLPWWAELSEVRQRALIELRFCLGMAGLMLFRWTLAHLKAGEYEAAATSLLASRWAQQVGSRRSERLAEMLREGR